MAFHMHANMGLMCFIIIISIFSLILYWGSGGGFFKIYIFCCVVWGCQHMHVKSLFVCQMKYYNYKQLCYVLTCVLIVSYKEQKSKRRITRTLLLFELSISVFRMQVVFFLSPSAFSQARLQILFYFNEQWNSGEEVNVPYQACTHGESHRRARFQEVCWDEEDDKCFVIISNSLLCSPGALDEVYLRDATLLYFSWC